jgi:mRNA interferase RelE/StbE
VSYLIALSAKAIKTLDRLDRKTEKRLQSRLEELAANPLDERISRGMETYPERRYSRVGAWRIVYEMEETAHRLVVITIQHRSRVYQEVKK